MKLRNLEGSEAADEIERLRAERDEAQAEANAGRQAEHDADVERRAVESERDRLREALRQLLTVMPVFPDAAKNIVGMKDRYNAALDAARAALMETLTDTTDTSAERAEAERDEAVATLALYRMEHGCTRGQRTTQWCGEATRLRAGLMRVIQYENECDQTGQSCDASRRCACSLEAETWCRT